MECGLGFLLRYLIMCINDSIDPLCLDRLICPWLRSREMLLTPNIHEPQGPSTQFCILPFFSDHNRKSVIKYQRPFFPVFKMHSYDEYIPFLT